MDVTVSNPPQVILILSLENGAESQYKEFLIDSVWRSWCPWECTGCSWQEAVRVKFYSTVKAYHVWPWVGLFHVVIETIRYSGGRGESSHTSDTTDLRAGRHRRDTPLSSLPPIRNCLHSAKLSESLSCIRLSSRDWEYTHEGSR